EVTAGRILELYGVRRPPQALVGDAEAAGRAAARLGFPVAVKAVAAELPHKAEAGGVRLDIRSLAAATEAAGEVLDAARAAGVRSPRILVQRMVGGVEVLVGAVIDERFGPSVTMRPGGEAAERGDASFVAAPLATADARSYVEARAAACGLDGRRHAMPAVVRTVVAIARAAHDLRDRLASLEANPLLVDRRATVAVDALAETRTTA
ncbi:MAG TPA: acetate--CoA ligase family protein, partial [Actinomycetota bacterium]|nr:acetate--CoA ligase family protein [Actinomycetota bacterium]